MIVRERFSTAIPDSPQRRDACLRAVFFGNSESVFSSQHFRELLDIPCDLVGVVNVPAEQRRGATTNPLPAGLPVFTDVAQERGIPVLASARTDDAAFLEQLRALEPDLFIAAGYALILKPETLEIPHLFAVNIHASLLPEYKGKHPVFWTLRGSERWAGSTMHLMDPGIDTGDILYQVRVRTRKNDTVASLYNRIMDRSVEMIGWLIADLTTGDVERTPQQGEGSYFSSTTEADFRIDWAWDAEKIRRYITMTPGKCFAEIAGEPVHFLDAQHVTITANRPPGEIIRVGRMRCVVTVGYNAVSLGALQRSDGSELSMAAFCRERGLKPGDQLSQPEMNDAARSIQ